MLEVIKPPAALAWAPGRASVFLAGSIEMGTAPQWQPRFEAALAAAGGDVDVVALNPRRDDWDASWDQRMHNPRFREQVEWELAAQERADVIAMYFAPETRAPVTLLELGLFARSGKVLVACPEGYWRRGNVEVVCARYGVPLVDTLEELVAHTLPRLGLTPGRDAG
jgi:hypothetical protein